MKRGLLILTIAAICVGLLPLAAGAACTQAGEIIQVDAVPTGGNVLVHTSTTAPFVYLCTASPQLTAIAASAMSNKRVLVTGNAAACPAAGVLRNMGTCVRIVVNP